jgi:hypothetical protein
MVGGLDLRPHPGDLGDLSAAVLPDRPAAFATLATGGLVRDRLPGLRGSWQRPVARTQPPLPGLAPVPNPVVYLPQAKTLFELFRNLAALCLFPGMAGAIAALVVRFRRSHGIERQQLKWFTYAAALAPLPFLAHDFAPSLSGLLETLVPPLVPISVGIAILRYRLYEIDRIINRTLVYLLLTAVLGLCYAAESLAFVLVAGTATDPRAGWSPPRRWPRRRSFARLGGVSRPRLTAASTAANTTPPRPSRCSPPACASRSTLRPSPPSCWRSWTRPWSRPGSRSGFDPPHTAPRAPPPVGHGQLPGPTEPLIRASGRYQSGCPSVKAPQRRTTGSQEAIIRAAESPPRPHANIPGPIGLDGSSDGLLAKLLGQFADLGLREATVAAERLRKGSLPSLAQRDTVLGDTYKRSPPRRSGGSSDSRLRPCRCVGLPRRIPSFAGSAAVPGPIDRLILRRRREPLRRRRSWVAVLNADEQDDYQDQAKHPP